MRTLKTRQVGHRAVNVLQDGGTAAAATAEPKMPSAAALPASISASGTAPPPMGADGAAADSALAFETAFALDAPFAFGRRIEPKEA